MTIKNRLREPLRTAFEASWKRNRTAYEYLGRNDVDKRTSGIWEGFYSEEDGEHTIRMGSALKDRAIYSPHHVITYNHGLYLDDVEWGEAEANVDFITAITVLLEDVGLNAHLYQTVITWIAENNAQNLIIAAASLFGRGDEEVAKDVAKIRGAGESPL